MRRQQSHHRLLWALALAVVVHLAFVPMLAPLLPEAGESGSTRRRVKLVSLASRTNQPQKLEQRARQRPPEEKKEDKKKEEDEEEPEKLEGQVVDLPPSPDDTPPEDAKYLSEYNTRTERETKSRHQQKDYKNAMNERTVARKSEATAPKKSKKTTAIEVGPEKPNPNREEQRAERDPSEAREIPDLEKRERLALNLDSELGEMRNQKRSEAMRGNSDRLKLSLGDEQEEKVPGSAPRQSPTMADLVPEVGVLARLDGAPANDHLEDVEEGEGTFLNSREFKYASFFNRMKRGVSQHWNPISEYRRRDPSGNIYGFRSRVTILDVTLDQSGALKKVEVKRSSGLDFLDREAVAAFRRAQPFPNPPQGLIDNGIINFPFGFHVDFNQGGLLPF